MGLMRRARLRTTTQAVGATLSIPVSVTMLPDWFVFDISAFVLPARGSSRPANEGEVSIEMAVMLEIEPEEIWGLLIPPLVGMDTANPALTDTSGRVNIAIAGHGVYPDGLIQGVIRILATHVASGAAVWKTLTIDQSGRVSWLGSGALSGGSEMPSDFKQPEPGGERDYRAPYERAGMGWRGR